LGFGTLTTNDFVSAINGGALSAGYHYVGSGGTGNFTQNGGTESLTNSLYLGFNAGDSGTFSLSGSGRLSAASEFVGYNPDATAAFLQAGGGNVVSLLSIGSGGTYQLGGGTLQVNGNLLNQGILSGGSAAAILSANGIVDLSGGTLQNLGSISLSISANSLLIVPAGFNPSTGFASFSSLGLTHTIGTTLTVAAGQGFGGSGSISDPINCQGSILAASGGAINISGGLTFSGTIQLGSGNLTTNDPSSAMSGGSLFVANHFVGNGGTGTFTQTGGTNNVGQNLYLGYNPTDSGKYNLSGSGYFRAQANTSAILALGHLLSRAESTTALISKSDAFRVAAAPTISAAAVSSRHPTSNWDTPARAASRNLAGPTLLPRRFISEARPALAEVTAFAAADNYRP
jgi:hypothetical protein